MGFFSPQVEQCYVFRAQGYGDLQVLVWCGFFLFHVQTIPQPKRCGNGAMVLWSHQDNKGATMIHETWYGATGHRNITEWIQEQLGIWARQYNLPAIEQEIVNEIEENLKDMVLSV